MVKVIDFYDVGQRKNVRTSKYIVRIIRVNGQRRKQLVARSPRGYNLTKFVKMSFTK